MCHLCVGDHWVQRQHGQGVGRQVFRLPHVLQAATGPCGHGARRAERALKPAECGPHSGLHALQHCLHDDDAGPGEATHTA